MKKWIGRLMIVTPFVGLFIHAAMAAGVFVAIGLFLFSAIVCGFIAVGVYLVVEG